MARLLWTAMEHSMVLAPRATTKGIPSLDYEEHTEG